MEDILINDENVDLTKCPAIQQKRTLAFVNHFIISTVEFLNAFSKTCEYKLMEFERKLDKMEAATVLLETRLSSIPELNKVKAEQPILPPEESSEAAETPSEPSIETSPEPSIGPEYNKFIKMVQVGVPLEAAKQKASVEGLDPSILERAIKH